MIRFIELFAGIGGFRYGLEHIDVSQKRGGEKVTQGSDETGEGLYPISSKGGVHKDGRDNELRNGSINERQFTCVYTNEFNKYAASIYERHYGNNKETQEERNKTSRTDSSLSNGESPTLRRSEPPYGCVDTRDIREVDASEIPDHDLLTGGFPCQSFSIAGKRGGFEDTRGTLFFEIARILQQKQPRLLLLENVKGLLSHDKGKTFGTILNTLDELGYDLQWQVLNSKDFGVPQNRERVFIIGHLRGTSRPEVFPIGNSSSKTVSKTILDINQAQRVYGTEGVSITQKALGGGQGAKTGLYAVPVLTPDRLIKRQNGRRFKDNGDDSFTLTGQDKHGIYDGMKIRRLTPTECERLQGFPDGWTEGVSDTQRYKCLGNAVTTNVITAIGERMAVIFDI